MRIETVRLNDQDDVVVLYVDTSGLTKIVAEEYMETLATQLKEAFPKNKLVVISETILPKAVVK